MKFFGRTQPLSHYPIQECLAVLKRLGFDGVEVCLEHPDLAPAGLTEDQAFTVRDRIAELGLTCSVSYHKNYIFNDDLFAEIKKAIQLTPAFGADVFVFAGTGKRGDADEWTRKIERTRELVRVAEDTGVILAEEFEPGFIVGCTADLHRLFEAIPSDHLRANLDLGHVFLCDPDPMAAIASLSGRVVHCHIENMAAGAHCHLPPWEGDMDLAQYLSALADIGYDGPLALDLYNQDYEEVGEKAVQYLRILHHCG